MRLIDADALKETLDKIPARSIENADGRTYVLIRLSTVFEIIKQMSSAQPEVIRCKDCKFADWDLDGEGGECNKMDVNDPFYIDYDFFCAKAERKKGETD